jgi:Spy/CpxP family protein refolding chaperone
MQGPPPGNRGGMIDPDRSSQMMKQALNLSDDQTAQIRHILEETRSKLEAMRDSTSLSQEDRRSQMMALHQSVSERISAVLTPEQRTKFQEMQQQMRDRMRQQHEGDAGAPPPPAPQAPQR